MSLILIQVKQSGVLVNLFHTFFTLIKRLQLNCKQCEQSAFLAIF
ncbi:hypothetical protein AT1219_100002 [Vibrio alginolyticus]